MKNSNSRIGNLARKAMFALVAGALSTVSAQTDHAALTGTRNSTDGLKITSGFKLTSSSYTVEVWVRPAALGDTLPMMDQFKGGTSGDWRFCVYPNVSGAANIGKMALFTRNLSAGGMDNWILGQTVLPTNRWSHVAVSVGEGWVRFYLNGKPDGAYAITAGESIVPTPSAPFYLGGCASGCFLGQLADCRVWNTVRTEAEIAQLRFTRLQGTEAGLAAYWPLDEGTGTTAMEKSSNTPSAITGSGIGWTEMSTPFFTYDATDNGVAHVGVAGTASGRMTAGDFHLATPQFTLEAWMCPTNLTSDSYLFEQWHGSADGAMLFGLYPGSGYLTFFFRGFAAGNWYTTDFSPPLDRWTHAAVACDGDTIRIYVNGTEIKTVARTAAAVIAPNAGHAFRLGGSAGYKNSAFGGLLSECRVWETVRTQSEIASNLYTRLTGGEEGLAAYWPLNETSGSTAYNCARTRYGIDATIEGEAVRATAPTPFRGIPAACATAGTYLTTEPGVAQRDRGIIRTQSQISGSVFSLEAWIMPEALDVLNWTICQDDAWATGGVRFGVWPLTATDAEIGMRACFFYRGFCDGNKILSPSSYKISRTKWTHLAATCDGDVAKLYLDGVCVTSVNRTATSVLTPPTGLKIHLRGIPDYAEMVNGGVTDCRVWDRVLSDDEIAARQFDRLSGDEDGLIGYWPLNETGGLVAHNCAARARVIADDVLVGEPLRVTGLTPLVARTNVVDDSAVLGGGCFDTNLRLWQSRFTLEAWVYLTAHGNNVIFNQFAGAPKNDLRMIVWMDGKIGLLLRNFNSDGWAYSNATIPLRTWTHVAAVGDGEAISFYVNGVKDTATCPRTASEEVRPTTDAGLVEGQADGVASFNGSVCDLRVWNRARSAAEIAATYHQRLTGKEPFLMGYWPLGQGDSF